MNALKKNVFLKLLADTEISYTLALTGSVARGESRNNSSQYDYTSDVDVLCIVEPEDIPRTLSCKNKCNRGDALILMSREALRNPSNAILSFEPDSFKSNGLHLKKPEFKECSIGEFFSYQAQPLAYYTALLNGSRSNRRLYSKISITCLKLLYLSEHLDRRSFIYENELELHDFSEIPSPLIKDIIHRNLPDKQLQIIARQLEKLIARCAPIVENANFLNSTKLYFSKNIRAAKKEILEVVFLENNKLTRADSLFLKVI